MIIKVRVIPTAGRNEIISRIGSVLRMKIKNKKVDDGPANAIMKTFLADFFAVREDQIIIIKGEKGKEKLRKYLTDYQKKPWKCVIKVKKNSAKSWTLSLNPFPQHQNRAHRRGFLCFLRH